MGSEIYRDRCRQKVRSMFLRPAEAALHLQTTQIARSIFQRSWTQSEAARAVNSDSASARSHRPRRSMRERRLNRIEINGRF